MSNATALKYAPSMGLFGSLSGSVFGRSHSRIVPVSWGDRLQVDHSQPELSLPEKLEQALLRAKKAVRQRAAYLGPELTDYLVKTLTELYDPQEWGEGYLVPSYRSVDSLLRTILALHLPLISLTISEGGHVRGTWSSAEWKVAIEGCDDGSISWLIVRERADTIERVAGVGTATDLRAALAH